MLQVGVDDLWATIPGDAVLVCAGVLVAGAPAVASAREQGHEAHAFTWVVSAMTPKPIQKAPCCVVSRGDRVGPFDDVIVSPFSVAQPFSLAWTPGSDDHDESSEN